MFQKLSFFWRKTRLPFGTRGRLRNSIRITLTSRMMGSYEVTDSWLHGVTVFGKFRPITGLRGKFLPIIDPHRTWKISSSTPGVNKKFVARTLLLSDLKAEEILRKYEEIWPQIYRSEVWVVKIGVEESPTNYTPPWDLEKLWALPLR